MKILLLNAHSPQNAGDLAILQEAIRYLREAFPVVQLAITINDDRTGGVPDGPLYLQSLTRWLVHASPGGEWRWQKLRALPYTVWLLIATLLYRLTGFRLFPRSQERRRLMQAYYDADIVTVIGGGHLYARHRLNIAFLWSWLGLALAVLLGKPLVLLPQSFGPLPGVLQRRLLAWIVERSTFAAAREYRSLSLLAEIGVRSPVVVLPDLAFTTSEAPDAAVGEVLDVSAHPRVDPQPVIGLTLMDWGGQHPGFNNQRRYEAALLALICYLRSHYAARVILFAQCTGPTPEQDDRRVARRVIAAAGGPEDVLLVDTALSPDMLKAAYRRMDLLIATRMHSAIFALSAGVPTLVIGYLHKSIGIMEMLGLQRHVVAIDAVDPEVLCTSFDRLWAERGVVRAHLRARIPAVQQTLQCLPPLLRQRIGP